MKFFPFEVDMLIKLSCLLIVDGLELFKESFFLGRISDVMIMLNEMLVSKLFDSIKDILLHLINY